MAATDTARTGRLTEEYGALTGSCGLLDRSARGKLALSGPGAKEFLAGQVTNDIEALAPGEGCYAAFLTHKGKMLGDMRVLCIKGAHARSTVPDEDSADEGDTDEELLLDTERSALQALFDVIRRFQIGYDVKLHKRTLERGLLSLIGPASDRVAGVGVGEGPDAPLLCEHANAAAAIDGIDVLAIRTDVGIDLICDAADTNALARALCERGAVPISEAAAEIVRVESGRPRYGIDLDETVIPQEAGLNERAVSFTKGCYVGQETVARLHYKGKPNRHLRGLRLSEPLAPGAELHLGERQVGRLTSSVLSPVQGPIGLALVRREAEPGTRVSVGEGGGADAEIVQLPFDSAPAPSPPHRPDQRGASR